MAEPSPSESSPDTDRDFDPTAEQLIMMDDERTLIEEDAKTNEKEDREELNDLNKESEMPIEKLLAMYGYHSGGGAAAAAAAMASSAAAAPVAPTMTEKVSHSSGSGVEEEIIGNHDLILDKDQVVRDLLPGKMDLEKVTPSVSELLHSVSTGTMPCMNAPPMDTDRLLRSQSQESDSSSVLSTSDDDDNGSGNDTGMNEEEWKKCIQVGTAYQANIPPLGKYGDIPAYENDDCLMWDPSSLDEKHVENFLLDVKRDSIKQVSKDAVAVAVPTGNHVRDDEKALFTLQKCSHNMTEALRRMSIQPGNNTNTSKSDMTTLWSEEECSNFEDGLEEFGKDFFKIQEEKVRTRTVAELIHFYYVWKKTERHDMFVFANRFEKKKYALHPGVTDYMDRFIDEQENPSSSTTNSLLSCHRLNLPTKPMHNRHLPHQQPTNSAGGYSTSLEQLISLQAGSLTDVAQAAILEVAGGAVSSSTPALPDDNLGYFGADLAPPSKKKKENYDDVSASADVAPSSSDYNLEAKPPDRSAATTTDICSTIAAAEVQMEAVIGQSSTASSNASATSSNGNSASLFGQQQSMPMPRITSSSTPSTVNQSSLLSTDPSHTRLHEAEALAQ